MRTAKVVLGAGWGDCGKGKLVDHYATSSTTVVRFSGGSNAGHTVIRNGKRHVFRHFGSGTLRGAKTFLSRYFISNPILYFQELAVLNAIGVYPTVVVDPDSLLSVPFDMMLNQMVEQARGADRHGSCGVGLNEAIKRSEAGFPLRVADLAKSATLRDILQTIRVDWLPRRLAQLAVVPSAEWQARLASAAILDRYIEQCVEYQQCIGAFDWSGDVVFEGAQGLLLDQEHRFFPYVTHARTGLHNVMALASQAGLDALEVTYVTRAYATRHGAGPFPHEVLGLAYEDRTNVTNDWQGRLRFGHLDLDLLAQSIAHDRHNTALPTRHGLAITCLDQVDDVTFWLDGRQQVAGNDDFAQQACDAVNATFCLTSRGATAGFSNNRLYRNRKINLEFG